MDTSGDSSAMVQTPTDREYRFQGEIDKLRALLPIIKSCRVGKNMTFLIMRSGFKLIGEDESLSIQGSIYLNKRLFKSYDLPDGSQTLDVRIDTFLALVEMLFPSPTAESSMTHTLNTDTLRLTLDGHSFHLSAENGPQQKGKASMATQDRLTDIRNISMTDVNRVCFDAFVMVDFWNFADLTSQFVYITFDDTMIVFGTESQLGKADYVVEAESSHMETFSCNQPMKQSFQMKLMKYTAPIAKKAKKISIGMDSSGTLNMKVFVVLSPDTQVDTSNFPSQTQASVDNPENNVFVEYYIAASVIDQ